MTETLRDLWQEAVKRWPEKTFAVFEDCNRNISQVKYNEFYRQINRSSNFFLDLGIEKGEKVAIQLNNSLEFMLCWFGLAQIGAILVPINVNYKQEEVNYILDKCEVRYIVTEKKYLINYTGEKAYRYKKVILARLNENVCIDSNILNFAEEIKDFSPELSEYRQVKSEDVFEILFTSGTTEKPKGVLMTHYNALYAGKVHAWQCDMKEDDRFFTSMPCFHIDFQFMAVMSVLTIGGTVIIAERFSASNFWRQVCQFKANITDMMPFLVRTVMLKKVEPWERNHSLRNIYFSMCLSTEEKEAFEERFKVRLLNCYGSTETVSCVTSDFAYGERRWPSVGKPAIGYEVRIVGKNGSKLSAGEIGSIQIKGIRGKSLMLGYYNDDQATKKVFDGDWFVTGDEGYLDEEGWLYFVDRDKNMIKRSGESVSTSEIENVLTAHPLIEEAAVIGVPDPLREQAIKAIVKLKTKDESSLSEEDIICYCAQHLADFKVPSIVEFCNDFPHTCTGKIQKNLLK